MAFQNTSFARGVAASAARLSFNSKSSASPDAPTVRGKAEPADLALPPLDGVGVEALGEAARLVRADPQELMIPGVDGAVVDRAVDIVAAGTSRTEVDP